MLESFIIQNEGVIRAGVFIGILGAVAVAEYIWPRRKRIQRRASRWFSNLSIAALNVLLLRLFFPILAVGLAVRAQELGWGLFNNVDLPTGLEVFLAIVLFDLAIYLQHVVFHRVPLLWRLHKMHHVDLDIDVTTGARFHPIEIILSMIIKIGVVFLIGPAAVAVILFEVILNGMAMFNHGNLRLPQGVDRVLRKLIVTPDMHRVHHSVDIREYNRNFGFNLSLWDRLFRTYRSQPAQGHENMRIGQADWCDPTRLTLPQLIAFPFLKGADAMKSGTAETRG